MINLKDVSKDCPVVTWFNRSRQYFLGVVDHNLKASVYVELAKDAGQMIGSFQIETSDDHESIFIRMEDLAVEYLNGEGELVES